VFCEGNRPTSSYGLALNADRGPGLPPVALRFVAMPAAPGALSRLANLIDSFCDSMF
jgi:hypothetical protein